MRFLNLSFFELKGEYIDEEKFLYIVKGIISGQKIPMLEKDKRDASENNDEPCAVVVLSDKSS